MIETDEDREVMRKLVNSFPYFAKSVLKIRTKSGEMKPFVLNRAQIILHEKLEDMLRRIGRVRVMLVKSRQMGGSTYMEGRFFHKLWRTDKSMNAFIFAHEEKAASAVFNMAKQFHENMPPELRPETEKSNSKELKFSHNRSYYTVATAGTQDVGRGTTIQLFHGSEVSRWPNAEIHSAGVAQAVPKEPETEIVLESTAAGIGNLFNRMTMAAVGGKNDYEVVFMPWFWHEEYEVRESDVVEWAALKKWNPPEGWLAYAKEIGTVPELGRGLTWEQLYWAYLKNVEIAVPIGEELDEPCWLFRQEYPSNLLEAFQTSGTKGFIPSAAISAARNPREQIVGRGPLVLGVDPSRSGDFVGVVSRRGRRMGAEVCLKLDPQGSLTYVASQIAQIIQRITPDHVCIDTTGNGAAIYDILRDTYRCQNLEYVNFSQKGRIKDAGGNALYNNRRSEIWDQMRLWFTGDQDVQIADRDDLHRDLGAVCWGAAGTRYNSSGQLCLEEKDAIKKRLDGMSPDLGDAAALTFAIPFHLRDQNPAGASVPRVAKRKTGY